MECFLNLHNRSVLQHHHLNHHFVLPYLWVHLRLRLQKLHKKQMNYFQLHQQEH